MSTEPKRLRHGSDALAASLASLQQALPSEERMAALAASLARAGAPIEVPTPAEAPAPADPPAPRSELRAVRAAKLFGPGTLAILAALVFGGGLIALALFDEEAAPPSPRPAPLAASPTPAAAPSPTAAATALPRAEPPRTVAGAADTVPAAPPPSLPREPAAAAPLVPPAPAASSGNAPVVERDTSTHAEAPAAPAAPPRPVAKDDGRTVASTGRTRPTPADSASEGAPLAANTVVESEIELLKQARSALGADPLQAFALSERCRSQYPNGAFAQEREYIAISALVRLGRTSDARSRASLFRMHYPNSAYLPRLARMLGE